MFWHIKEEISRFCFCFISIRYIRSRKNNEGRFVVSRSFIEEKKNNTMIGFLILGVVVASVQSMAINGTARSLIDRLDASREKGNFNFRSCYIVLECRLSRWSMLFATWIVNKSDDHRVCPL